MKRIPMLLLYFLHSDAASLQASFVKEDARCQEGISPPVNKPIPTADALITPIPLDSKNSIYSSKPYTPLILLMNICTVNLKAITQKKILLVKNVISLLLQIYL